MVGSKTNQPLTAVLLGCILLIFVAGCSVCAGPFDCHYAAYGGSTPRGDMINGRVGSAFNNAGLMGVPTSNFVADDPYYQNSNVPLESGETIISEGEFVDPNSEGVIIDPASEPIYEDQSIMPQVEGNEWIPDSSGGYDSGEIINETLQAPIESFEDVPAMPEVQLDDGIQFPDGSSTR